MIQYFLLRCLTSGFLDLWATEEFFKSRGLVLLKSNTFCKMDLKSKMWVASELAGLAFATGCSASCVIKWF